MYNNKNNTAKETLFGLRCENFRYTKEYRACLFLFIFSLSLYFPFSNNIKNKRNICPTHILLQHYGNTPKKEKYLLTSLSEKKNKIKYTRLKLQ